MIYELLSFRLVIISRVRGGNERAYSRIALRSDNYIKFTTMWQVLLPISIAFVFLFHEMKKIHNYYSKILSWMSRNNMLNLRLIKSTAFSSYFLSISSEKQMFSAWNFFYCFLQSSLLCLPLLFLFFALFSTFKRLCFELSGVISEMKYCHCYGKLF